MSKQRAELELERNPRFVAAERRVQRIGVGMMVAFVVAGGIGLFGDGVLSTATARAGSLVVTYERLTRQSVRNTIAIETTSADIARVALEQSFLEALEIHEIRPAQVRIEQEADHVIFLVPATEGVARLVLRVEPLHPGILRTRVTAQGGSTVDLRQIVFF